MWHILQIVLTTNFVGSAAFAQADPCVDPAFTFAEEAIQKDVVVKGTDGVETVVPLIITGDRFVHFTDLVVGVESDDDLTFIDWDGLPVSADAFAYCEIYDELGQSIGQPEAIDQHTGYFIFEDAFTVPAFTSMRLSVQCALSDIAVMNDTPDAYAVYVVDWVAEDDQGDSIGQACAPWGFPNEHLDQWVEVLNHGELEIHSDSVRADVVWTVPEDTFVPAIDVRFNATFEEVRSRGFDLAFGGNWAAIQRVHLFWTDPASGTSIGASSHVVGHTTHGGLVVGRANFTGLAITAPDGYRVPEGFELWDGTSLEGLPGVPMSVMIDIAPGASPGPIKPVFFPATVDAMGQTSTETFTPVDGPIVSHTVWVQ